MENYSIRQLSQISGYSGITLTRIKDYWLEQSPKEVFGYGEVHYLVFDATYFHKNGCLLNLMEAASQRIIAHLYVNKESFKEAYPWFISLKLKGLNPLFITTDGEQSIMRAMRHLWPQAKLQRCLYHLQHEGMRWLRTHPKTEAGISLRALLSRLSSIKTKSERNIFISDYAAWTGQYRDLVRSLPKTTVAAKDLKRTMALLNHALPDMFHYLEEEGIPATTNDLEGFHSRLKADYRRHRGLSKEHKIQFIDWYCYFENEPKTNLF